MKPTISSLSADNTVSAMSEVHDNAAAPIDFHAISEQVVAMAEKVKAPVVEQSGALKQLWNGLLDDIAGPKKRST